jgi:hypothetical protein
MTMAEQKKIGRLAIREEGESINAYYAMPGTMEGAILLFSVSRAAAMRPSVKEKILALGKQIVEEILYEAIGERPTWPDGPEPAPEHERAGRA